MLMTKLIESVRYPDEAVGGYDDRIPYEDAIAGLEVGTKTDATKSDCEATIAELKKRWDERRTRKAV